VFNIVGMLQVPVVIFGEGRWKSWNFNSPRLFSQFKAQTHSFKRRSFSSKTRKRILH